MKMVSSIILLTVLPESYKDRGVKTVEGVGRQSLLLKKGKGVERKVNRYPAPLRSGQVRISLLLHPTSKVQTFVLQLDESVRADVNCLVTMSLIMKQTYAVYRVISYMVTYQGTMMESAVVERTDLIDQERPFRTMTLSADWKKA